MDRYVLAVGFCQSHDACVEGHTCLEPLKQFYERLVDISADDSVEGISAFSACSLSGAPSKPRWYFALQTSHRGAQFCSSDWEELGTDLVENDSDEVMLNEVETHFSSLRNQEGLDPKADLSTLTELMEEAAEGLQLLSDQLPPPGKALLDVVVVAPSSPSPPVKELLPLLGVLKHLSSWHAAKISVVSAHGRGWQKVASSLGAHLVELAEMDQCIENNEMWRGGLVVREKKHLSELRFDGFCLRAPVHHQSSLSQAATTDHNLQAEVFHYYAPVLDLVGLVDLSGLPSFLMSSSIFELSLCGRSMKAQLLLDQLRSLRGKVGALFSLFCTVTPTVQPVASQLSSQRWRDCLAKKPKSLLVPEVDVRGERAVYFLLIQGSEDAGSRICRVRMLHSDKQINGAAAMATVSALLENISLSLPEPAFDSFLSRLPVLQGHSLLKRERKVTQVQTLVLKEYLEQKEKATTSASVPVNDLKVILNQVREQHLKIINTALPTFDPSSTQRSTPKTPVFQNMSVHQSEWPEKSVLFNLENLQKKRFGLYGPGSSDSLLGPKDNRRTSSAPLDAKELLRHFTVDGLPTGELHPLAPSRDNVRIQVSPDLSPSRFTNMPFSKASASRYHGIEFCLDNQHSLDQDRASARLQSRLIRYETQTTCSKEPCGLPFALSPAPSPAVMSEPGSVPDGESLQNNDVTRIKRRSREADVGGGRPCKRLVKSESSDSLCSQSSGNSGTHPVVMSLRQQARRSRSTSSSVTISPNASSRQTTGLAVPLTDAQKPSQQKMNEDPTDDKLTKESRSQKHNRMLQEVVAKTLQHHGISAEHQRFEACSKRLFDISKFYLKDLKTSRGLHDEMKKAASSNAKQVIEWVLDKMK